jgi:hypothetical protein
VGFDDWVSEQNQAHRESANSQAADDQVRSANAARVVDALAAEMRTVIPRLRAFPAVTVQEHRVVITASITGSTVTVPN